LAFTHYVLVSKIHKAADETGDEKKQKAKKGAKTTTSSEDTSADDVTFMNAEEEMLVEVRDFLVQ